MNDREQLCTVYNSIHIHKTWVKESAFRSASFIIILSFYVNHPENTIFLVTTSAILFSKALLNLFILFLIFFPTAKRSASGNHSQWRYDVSLNLIKYSVVLISSSIFSLLHKIWSISGLKIPV